MIKAANNKVQASNANSAAPFFRKKSGMESEHGNDSETPFFTKSSTPSISCKNDPLEKEADAMADKVVQKKPMDHKDSPPQKVSQTSASGGFPLPDDLKQKMEDSFNADFSNVRLHTDNQAVQMSKMLNAQAFTVGNNIYFNTAKYDPIGRAGQLLLAHELTHTLQQNSTVTRKPDIQQAPEMIQRYPQSGHLYAHTPKQKAYESHRDDVVNIQGMESFSPESGLGNYISAFWETGNEVAVNIKYGSFASGYIFVKPTGSFVAERCVTVPLYPFGPMISICKNYPPDTTNYEAATHVIPFHHDAFNTQDKGTLVLLVKIGKGFIFGKMGWIAGKKADAVDPVMDASTAITDEAAFLPLIYGDEFTGSNYKSLEFTNLLSKGRIKLFSMGTLELANKQTIDGNSLLMDQSYVWFGHLYGKAKGVNDYDLKVERNSKGSLLAEALNLNLDKQWVAGSKDSEHGLFVLQGSLRASYKNKTFDIAGKASYSSSRIHGEVNISVTTESKAMQLFELHAPGTKVSGAGGVGGAGTPATTGIPTNAADDSGEPLAITAWGNMHFKLIGDNGAKAAGGGGGTAPPSKAKAALMNLEGEGAFAVSPDGYIILAGKVKFPYLWQFTNTLKYQSNDANDKDKHLFQKDITPIRAPVPFGTINLELAIAFDIATQLNPLYLYEIEVSGVYSNHPKYRSELGITPKLYISGSASATITASASAAYALGGLFTIGKVTGSLAGNAVFNAYINAEPTIKAIWEGGDKAANYAIAGAMHIGGQLTFHLTGNIDVEVIKVDVFKSGDYHIASWTLGSFGIQLLLKDYVLGSGASPEIDYSKMGFESKNRRDLAYAIAHEKDSSAKDDKQSGGFEQDVDGKKKETGTFSKTDTMPADKDKDPIIPYTLKDEFLMKDKLHELDVKISGTRAKPKAVLEMASDPKPIEDKITDEKIKLYGQELIVNEDDKAALILQEHDIVSLEKEAQTVEKNAEKTAESAMPGEEPEINGIKQLEDHITDYGKKYNEDDIGKETAATTPAPAAKQLLKTPQTNGASPEMESRLAYKRIEEGYETFDNFRRSNIAVARYYVLKPGSNSLDKKTADGPFYVEAVNKKAELHSEIIIAGMLQKIQSSKKFRKKYGPTHIIVVDQILTERSPCSQCRAFLENTKSSLIVINNFHTYFIVHYSGYWIARNRALMLKYGLQPPSLEELSKQYGGNGDIDPH